MNIQLTITNLHDGDYPVINLRKFFNMVFWGEDRKSLHIYTATVFCGCEHKEDDVKTPPCILVATRPSKLEFSYKIEGTKGKVKEFVDLTKSFFQQENCIKKVWGDCKLLTSQNDILEAINGVYPECNVPTIDINSEEKIFELTQNRKGDTHHCVVGAGDFKIRDSKNKSYVLSNEQCHGIEAMNWIKTTITLDKKFESNEKMFFSIVFAGKTSFFTPDFTWYFAPVAEHIVDVSNALVSVADKTDERNMMSTVADATTVDFKEWVFQENINERKKVRINFGEYTREDYYVFSGQKISTSFETYNPERHGNAQFVLGLIIAFLLSFCSDKTRINDYISCLEGICNCDSCLCSTVCNSLCILFPFIIILSFIALVFTNDRCLPHQNKVKFELMKWVKNIGLIFGILLSVYVYVLWMIVPQMMQTIINGCKINNIIIVVCSTISIISNLIYVLYCGCIRKKKIIDFL